MKDIVVVKKVYKALPSGVRPRERPKDWRKHSALSDAHQLAGDKCLSCSREMDGGSRPGQGQLHVPVACVGDKGEVSYDTKIMYFIELPFGLVGSVRASPARGRGFNSRWSSIGRRALVVVMLNWLATERAVAPLVANTATSGDGMSYTCHEAAQLTIHAVCWGS